MKPLTKRQAEILAFCRAFVREHGYAPTLAEIGAEFGLSSLATVYKHMANLETKGHIRRAWNRARHMEFVEPPDEDAVSAFRAGFSAAITGARIEDALAEFSSRA